MLVDLVMLVALILGLGICFGVKFDIFNDKKCSFVTSDLISYSQHQKQESPSSCEDGTDILKCVDDCAELCANLLFCREIQVTKLHFNSKVLCQLLHTNSTKDELINRMEDAKNVHCAVLHRDGDTGEASTVEMSENESALNQRFSAHLPFLRCGNRVAVFKRVVGGMVSSKSEMDDVCDCEELCLEGMEACDGWYYHVNNHQSMKGTCYKLRKGDRTNLELKRHSSPPLGWPDSYYIAGKL